MVMPFGVTSKKRLRCKMDRFGKFNEEEFLAVCKMSGISESSSQGKALRTEFERVFAGDGSAEEAAHVTALLEQLHKATPEAGVVG